MGIYDAYRDALALGLQRAGVTDLRAANDAELAAAADFLEAAVAATDARFTDDGASEGLPEGTFAVHQAWSGDILTAPRYAAEEGDDPREVAAALRYWSPGGAERVVGLDLTAICSRGRNPVAAHAFLDHLLRFDVALDNFAWNGYQVPMTGATRGGVRRPVLPVARGRAREPALRDRVGGRVRGGADAGRLRAVAGRALARSVEPGRPRLSGGLDGRRLAGARWLPVGRRLEGGESAERLARRRVHALHVEVLRGAAVAGAAG